MSVNIETVNYRGWEIQVYQDNDGKWYAHGNNDLGHYSTESASAHSRQDAVDRVMRLIDKEKSQ